MEQTQGLLQKWDARARRLYPRMEISREGLTLGAGTVFAIMARDGRGHARLVLDDEPRAMALLATAYERPGDVRLLAKLRRAAELWNDGEEALAHIHLAHAGLPPCEEEQALRLFVADELIEAGVAPETLMKAQGFDPAPLALLKYNPDQPRVPAGSGRESGEWTSGGAGNGRESGGSTRGGAGNGNESGGSSSDDAHITPVAFRSRRERGRHRRGAYSMRSTVSSNGCGGGAKRRPNLPSSRSGRLNRICLGRATGRRFQFRDYLTTSRESTPPTGAPGWRTTRSILASRNSSPSSRNWVGRKSQVWMGRS